VEWAHSFIGLRLQINYESASEEHIHSIAEKGSSRKPGFRCIGCSETELPVLPYSRKLRGQKEGQGIATASLAPYPFPQGVMSRINMQMSVPGVTKGRRALTFFVIGVTIALVTSCWTRDSSFPVSQTANNQALFFPALLLTPPTRKAGLLDTL
jgi:hypothetical protein